NQANCLNPTAAAVWKHADGKSSVSEIAAKMSRDMGRRVDVGVVWYALEQLDKKHLLEERIQIPLQYSRLTRRDFWVKAGVVGAAVAIPVIISLTPPTPAMAATCTGVCTNTADCPSGCTCTGGSCV